MKPLLCIIGIVLTGWSPPSLRAQAAESISDISKSCLASAQSLRSAYCTFSVFNKTDGEKLADDELGIERDKILFDYLQKDPSGKTTWSERYVWNGSRACDLFRTDNNKMGIYRERFACVTMADRNVFLDPFAFLLGERDVRPGSCVTLAELSDPKEWERWVSSARIQGHETLPLGRCVVIECPGRTTALDHPRSNPYIMQVWFAVDHGCFPVRWKQISDGKTVAQFGAVSLGYFDEAKSLPYVREGEFYKVYTDGTVSDDVRVVVTSLEIDAHFSEDQFTIDPALAASIWDGTTKTWTKKLPAKPD